MDIHFFDRLSIEALFMLTFVLMVFMLELGFRLGVRKKGNSIKAQVSQVRALMGAALGLLAFMLAFTFSGARDHFENRIQFLVDEAVLAQNAFMQADLLAEPRRTQARQLLREFVEGRVKLSAALRGKNQEQVFQLLEHAGEIQKRLWSIGREQSANGDKEIANAVLSLMDMQSRRVHAALANRIPLVIWITLYFNAFLSMGVVGFQAGLSERRSPIATFSLALSFSAVMALIIDLDRPVQSLFAVDVAAMQQLLEFMRSLP